MAQQSLVPPKKRDQVKQGIAEGTRGTGFRQRKPEVDVKSVINKRKEKPKRKNQEADKLLLNGARNGDLEKVKQALEGGADVDAKSEDVGWPAIMHASTCGDPKIVQLLIDHGVDVNALGDDGWFAVGCAAKAGHVEVLELLKRVGAVGC